MRALVQRVKEGSVTINGALHARIQRGVVILLGVKTGDSPDEAHYLAEKCAALRIFEDEQGKMNLALQDVKGSALVVSQFTLYADTQKGNRPGFSEAARPEEAEALYEIFLDRMRSLLGDSKVQTGVFRAMMDVTIVNDGPVTIMVESR
jgi:D-aminoacyl-tRNA deacylase